MVRAAAVRLGARRRGQRVLLPWAWLASGESRVPACCHPMALRSRPLRAFASLRVLKNRSGSVDAAHACVTLRLCGRHLYMSFHRSAPRLRDEAVAADRGATGGVHATTAVAAASRAAVVVRGRFFFLSIR